VVIGGSLHTSIPAQRTKGNEQEDRTAEVCRRLPALGPHHAPTDKFRIIHRVVFFDRLIQSRRPGVVVFAGGMGGKVNGVGRPQAPLPGYAKLSLKLAGNLLYTHVTQT
jgi:hypothetical protein